MTVMQTVVTILYWSTLSVQVRSYLTQLVVEVDKEIQVDSNIDEASRQQWSETERLVKDDDAWFDLSPKILYLITMFHTFQILIGAWIIWTLLAHKKWLMEKNGILNQTAVIIRSSVPEVAIKR